MRDAREKLITQENSVNLKTPVRYLKGVGPKKSEILSRLRIQTVEDLLYYLPFRYEDRSSIIPIKELKAGEYRTIRGEIIAARTRITRSGAPIFQITVTDQTGFAHAVWFNQPYLKDYFRKGQNVVLYGKAEKYDDLQVVQPEYEILKGDESDLVHIGRIVPVYPLTSQISQRFIRALVYEAVSQYAKLLRERMPTYVFAREKIVDIKFAIRSIHFPSSFENLEKAHRRIVFEEFFMLQLALALKKKEAGVPDKGLTHVAEGDLVKSFNKSIPFELTAGQKKAMADIERDMTSSKPMNRLLEGDVGSGKTVVASYGLVLTVQNGFQGAIMAPTEVLARQHFIVLSELLMPLGITVTLLVGGMDDKARKRIYSEIKDGRINVIVGTHALIQESLKFNKLGLVVIDEQHKFGVSQRATIKEKGYNPHILVMTATPIPRTLALTVYGDLDLSIIKELPKGRGAISTYWVEEGKRAGIYNFIREEMLKGRQAYVVSPQIEKGQSAKLVNIQGAEEIYNKLKNDVFPDFEVGLLHGRMLSKEKDKIMRDFKKGKLKILVSTIVIEVGIDVPNATVMLIEHAERFGLAQLHQLRGRVGRGGYESFCIMLADPKSEEAARRLKAIEGTLDGFEIAEEDLEMRGPGEFFGTRQHGIPEIRFGNILKDFDIMELARKEAFAIVAGDPDLREDHHRPLRESLSDRFKGKLGLINVA